MPHLYNIANLTTALGTLALAIVALIQIFIVKNSLLIQQEQIAYERRPHLELSLAYDKNLRKYFIRIDNVTDFSAIKILVHIKRSKMGLHADKKDTDFQSSMFFVFGNTTKLWDISNYSAILGLYPGPEENVSGSIDSMFDPNHGTSVSKVMVKIRYEKPGFMQTPIEQDWSLLGIYEYATLDSTKYEIVH